MADLERLDPQDHRDHAENGVAQANKAERDLLDNRYDLYAFLLADC